MHFFVGHAVNVQISTNLRAFPFKAVLPVLGFVPMFRFLVIPKSRTALVRGEDSVICVHLRSAPGFGFRKRLQKMEWRPALLVSRSRLRNTSVHWPFTRHVTNQHFMPHNAAPQPGFRGAECHFCHCQWGFRRLLSAATIVAIHTETAIHFL